MVSRCRGGPFIATLALVVGGTVVGVKSKIPAGALLTPMFVGAVLSATHLVTITLPPWRHCQGK